jgi:hypothetical protein
MITPAWILSLMCLLVPPATAPWRDSFPRTAAALAAEANARPLFKGERGREETAALLVAWASFESAFDPGALGDCHGAKERTAAACDSHGLFQISKANAPSRELLEPEGAAAHAGRLFAESFRICRGRPRPELGAWFAAGGNGCKEAGFAASRHRFARAERLLREHPPLALLEDAVD